MTTTLYTAKQLTADRYHSDEFPQASGSVLAAIYSTCPAQWKYGDHIESKAMAFGTASHAFLLEPGEFDSRYVRGIDPADYPGALVTGKDIESWLKECGRKGYSGKLKAELIAMAKEDPNHPPILDDILAKHIEAAGERAVVPYADYDTIGMMRKTIEANGYGFVFAPGGGESEVSIIGDDLKCRIDRLLKRGNGEIWDYKTTTNVEPRAFGAQAFRMNYWLKMAVQADMFERHFGHLPDRVVLMAQSTKAPYLPVDYTLTADQLNVGRKQYKSTMQLIDHCIKTNQYPGYAQLPKVLEMLGIHEYFPHIPFLVGGSLELDTPGYAAYEFGMNAGIGDIEIVED